jgi:hypothetical protein
MKLRRVGLRSLTATAVVNLPRALWILALILAGSFRALAAATDPRAMPAEQFASFTADGAWCWFSDPRAVYHDGKLYAGWMTSNGSVQVGEFDPRGGGAPTVVTLAERFQIDDHDHPALVFLPDGRLAVFYAPHAAGDLHLRFTRRPGDLGEWTPDRTLGFDRRGGPRGVTYSNPVLLASEANALYVFWRGSDFKPTFAVSTDFGATWGEPRTLIRPVGSSNDVRPYVKYWSDGQGRIDFLFTDGHPRNEPVMSSSHLAVRSRTFALTTLII